MFERAGRHCEFEALLAIFIGGEAVNQCGGEAVPSADPVDNVGQLILLRLSMNPSSRVRRQADQLFRSALRLSRRVIAIVCMFG